MEANEIADGWAKQAAYTPDECNAEWLRFSADITGTSQTHLFGS